MNFTSDRSKLISLHGLSSTQGHQRSTIDSGTREERTSPWTKPPTFVGHPTLDTVTSTAMNPYDKSRMRDTMQAGSRGGNPVARATFAPTRMLGGSPHNRRQNGVDPPNKRQRISDTVSTRSAGRQSRAFADEIGEASTSTSARGSRRALRPFMNGDLARSEGPEFLDISMDEDTTFDTLRQQTIRESVLIEDGDGTRRLRERYAGRSSSQDPLDMCSGVEIAETVENDVIEDDTEDADVPMLMYPPDEHADSVVSNGRNPGQRQVNLSPKDDDIQEAILIERPHPTTASGKPATAAVQDSLKGKSVAKPALRPPQLVDLRAHSKLNTRKVANMKGKAPSKLHMQDKISESPHNHKTQKPAPLAREVPSKMGQDPIATRSSGFIRTLPLQPGVFVPLDSWYIDSKVYPKASYYLYWEDHTTKRLVIKKAPDLDGRRQEILLALNAGQIDSVKLSSSLETPLIQLKMMTLPRRGSEHNRVVSNARITFSFPRDDDMTLRQYCKIKDILHDLFNNRTGACETLNESGARNCWEMVIRDIEQASVQSKASEEKKLVARAQRPALQRHSSIESTDMSPQRRVKPKPAYKGNAVASSSRISPIRKSARQAATTSTDDPNKRNAEYQVASSSRLSPTPNRQSARQIGTTSRAVTPNSDEITLVYGSVNICQSDINRLRPGEFLNDKLIELGLKFWINDLRHSNPDLADQIHVFSSFFYKKLNNKNVEEGYKSIRKWTAKIDIFKKKFIIIPINENVHWYLAIIYHPEHVLRPPPRLILPPTPPVRTRGQKRKSNDAEEPQPTEPVLNLDTLSDIMHDSPSAAPSESGTIDQTTDEAIEEVTRSTQDCSLDDEPQTPPGDTEGSGRAPSNMDEVSDSEEERTGNTEDEVDQLLTDTDQVTPDGQTEDHVSMEIIQSDTSCSTPERPSSPGEDAPLRQADAPDELDLIGQPLSVPAKQFYASSKGKSKMTPKTQPFPMDLTSEGDSIQEDDITLVADNYDILRNSPYIFTFDSLGARHPQAIKLLRAYLRQEAEDKKGLKETTEPGGKQAFVPGQPNFCDCGLYLLHFAQTFMSDPDKYVDHILHANKKATLAEKQRAWNGAEVSSLRERMTQKILGEAETWKAKKRKDDEDRQKSGAGSSVEPTADASDDDDVVVEGMTIPEKPPPKKGKKALTSPNVVEAPLSVRLRG